MRSAGCGLVLLAVVAFSGCVNGKFAMLQQPSSVDETRYLIPIARQIGLNPPADRQASDIASDIRLALDGDIYKVPDPLPDTLVSEVSSVLRPAERRALLEMQEFLKTMKSCCVVALPKK